MTHTHTNTLVTLVTPETHQENIKYLEAMTEQTLLEQINRDEEFIESQKERLKKLNQTSSTELLYNEYHLEIMKSVSKTYRRQNILKELGI